MSDEYGWLIERTKLENELTVKWLAISYEGDIYFTDESHKALRFATKEFADDFIAFIHRNHQKHADGLVSTDHAWHDFEICPRCKERKTDEDCDGVEFNCGQTPEKACEGWSGMCCSCGADYAKGQM